MLESYLRSRLKQKDILLMTHLVVGYPSFEASFKIIEAMVNAGVDLMELQVPFSEPIADGPVILRANQKALESGATVQKSLDLAKSVARNFDIPFLIMTYYNILFKYGTDRFVAEMAERNLKGAIIPDLPPEEGADYLQAMEKYGLAPIMIYSPTTPLERMMYLSTFARGFIYCVARKGVTGQDTRFSEELVSYLSNCRKATKLPLAVGFGVKQKEDVDFLKGKADIAVIGTQTIRIVEEQGVEAVGDFIRGLR
ncbi:Tryptophan synthase alpha chain [uncultured Desulfobacterium sp.]|uniref:Tryptophan synthase alpha chain n=1 Tax=uncultured Desulfobacterium sp. TaxID=201089 RepID=A0A445N3P2_9BACT|nr:Tryptophan synthase alpha chain [uncultured Desulfobacterium sp.]